MIGCLSVMAAASCVLYDLQGTKLWIIMEYLGGGSALDMVSIDGILIFFDCTYNLELKIANFSFTFLEYLEDQSLHHGVVWCCVLLAKARTSGGGLYRHHSPRDP